MPRIIYIEHDDTPHDVEVPVGTSLMKGAIGNGVPGIDGECAGVMDCATCHVYVDRQWAGKLPPAGAIETDMLGFVLDAQDNSRLACQILCTEELHGMIVRMPRAQS